MGAHDAAPRRAGPVGALGAALALAAVALLAGCADAPAAPDDFGGPGDAAAGVTAGAGGPGGLRTDARAEAGSGAVLTATVGSRVAPGAADGSAVGSAPPAEGAATAPDATAAAPPIAAPGAAVRLTDGGCCVRPLWRADGRALWFIDRPPGGETGIYEARLDAPLAPPALLTTTVGSYSPDQRWRIELATGRTTLHRLADGAAFDVPAGGRSVTFSPDGSRIAWQSTNPGASFERQVARIVVAAPDGSGAAEVAQLPRGSLADWLGPDALLVRGRETADSDVEVLWRQPLDGSARTEILRSERLRNLALSPDKRWLAYTVSGAAAADANGLWLAPVDGAAPPRKLDGLFGAYRWRDGGRLVIVPFDVGAPSMRLVEVDAASATARPLTDPASLPLRIAAGDWSISPDGRHVAYVSAGDRNIWVLALPD